MCRAYGEVCKVMCKICHCLHVDSNTYANVRFHILCAYLLCEEDMSDFDPKLNSENLNKCLLSLKEFYRDLRHQKVQCRSFRMRYYSK